MNDPPRRLPAVLAETAQLNQPERKEDTDVGNSGTPKFTVEASGDVEGSYDQNTKIGRRRLTETTIHRYLNYRQRLRLATLSLI